MCQSLAKIIVYGTEEWRPILDGFYEASSTGKIRRSSKNLCHRSRSDGLVSQRRNVHGRLMVHISIRGLGHHYSVHRLIAQAFLGNCPAGMEVNHIDGDKRNNVASNLEYVTRKQNEEHAVMHGLKAAGNRHGSRTKPQSLLRGTQQSQSKLNEDKVRQIRQRLSNGEKCAKLAIKFGVSRAAIWLITSGKRWKHVA